MYVYVSKTKNKEGEVRKEVLQGKKTVDVAQSGQSFLRLKENIYSYVGKWDMGI